MNSVQKKRFAWTLWWTSLLMVIVMLLCAVAAQAAGRGMSSEVQSAVCRVFNQTGQQQDIGSGTLVDKTSDGRQGLVLTCWHLFRDGTGNIVVEFPDGRRHGAKLVHSDSQADLAALVITNPRPTPVSLRVVSGRQSAADSRQKMYACGYGSNGQFRCAVGPVVGESRESGQHSVLLQNPVRSGDSGGGVFDAEGRLVGVVWGEAQGVTYASCGKPLRRFLDRVLGQKRQSVVRQCPDGKCLLQPEPRTRTPRLAIEGIEDLQRQVEQLWQQKQDRGDYLTHESFQEFESSSDTRHASLLDQIRARSPVGGTGIGRAAGTAAVGLLGISGPAGWATIAAGTLGGWLIGRSIKKRRSAGGRRRRVFR